MKDPVILSLIPVFISLKREDELVEGMLYAVAVNSITVKRGQGPTTPHLKRTFEQTCVADGINLQTSRPEFFFLSINITFSWIK